MPMHNPYFEGQLDEQPAIQLPAGLLPRLMSWQVEFAGVSSEVLP